MVGFAVGLAVLYLTAGAWMVGLSMVTGALLLCLAVRGRRPSAGLVKRRRRVWSDEERRFILDRDGWACVPCGSQAELEIDPEMPEMHGWFNVTGPSYGDVDGDGVEDAIVITTYNGGAGWPQRRDQPRLRLARHRRARQDGDVDWRVLTRLLGHNRIQGRDF